MKTPKIALVTGASRGIGLACAQRLIQDGFFVIGSATSESGAAKISEHLGKQGKGVVLNVDDVEATEQKIQAMIAEHGVMDVLLNNAGITQDGLFVRMKQAQWDDVFSVNLRGVFALTQVVTKAMMKARKGSIINMSSVVASSGNPGQTNYSASKAGLEGFTRSLAMEVASRGIRVNSVAPGFIETDMTSVLKEEHKSALLSKIPAARMGTAQEIASVVSFLASDDSSYIQGAVIPVNGGMYMA